MLIQLKIKKMFIKHPRGQQSRRELKAVFFDLDETLVRNHIPVRQLFPTVFADFQDIIGIENKMVFFEVLQSEVKGLWMRMFSSDICPEQQLTTCFIKALNKTKAITPVKVPSLARKMVEHFFCLGSENVELHDGAIKTLENLRSKDITLGLITNGMKTLQQGKINTLGIEQYFDTITISAEARAHKPSKPIFDLAMSRAGTEPDQSWHVGDHITNDIAGAVRAGMHGIFYNPTNLHVERSFVGVLERPDYTINHLSELLEYL